MSNESAGAGDEPSATVRLATATNEAGAAVEIRAGERIVVGRAPSAAKLDVGGAGTREIRVAAAAVSANHLTAWLDGDQLCLQDVGSRNGSWLRLPATSVVRVDARQPIAMWLGLPSAGERADEDPADAEWSADSDFAPAVMRALSSWLDRRRIAARVGLSPRAAGNESTAHPGQIPLADGGELLVVPTGTVEIDWTRALATIWRYVARQNRLYDSEKSAREEGMILASDAIRQAHRAVVEAAGRGARILLIGPSGSGKEELARCYHRATSRSGPFVARNCAMFNKEFLRSELFGAEAGAFTGATHRIIGAVERAHGGTLFLDEIGDMPLEVQPMLLRFLDRAEYERVGAYGQTRTADVRLVCATNKDLRAASSSGDFRADLWFRLSIHVIEVPPLRQRLDDVVAYLKRRELTVGLSAHEALAGDALPLVLEHRWDGNFRELANFVERLPRDKGAGGVDRATCRRALELGALGPLSRGPAATAPSGNSDGWAQLAATAAEAFAADYQAATPATWDEVKEYVEKYFKPLVFARLGGIEAVADRAGVDHNALAKRIDADRGTVHKQLTRYFERFGRSS